jgi:NTP pyrophosphatase (non-canonical NTP hydrolase)
MNVKEASNEVRRKLGFINPNSKSDIEWMCRKIIEENKEVFDALA